MIFAESRLFTMMSDLCTYEVPNREKQGSYRIVLGMGIKLRVIQPHGPLRKAPARKTKRQFALR